ncbi:ABC transporter substrate-binding protein [Tissierella sp.]|uniref:ABC transporter substrate-binding protein n=1 Tax=Tissierella sp. TaxID=41274 RepID=UPI002860B9A6|nr:ABC transporter substrate-binding protein [Tissierella sp.]MDR7857753.1 ABC transporter substrate-binding protein [Tissierella sp.]
MMKKSIIFLLILTLVLSAFLVGCKPKDDQPVDTPGTGDVTPTDDPADVSDVPTEPTGQITIGNTTELSGDWVPYWTNNAADYDVYNFITGQATVDMTFEGEYLVNETTVKSYDVTENADGSKTYTWTINDGLVYADGSPITALDYVTSVMLWSSNQVQSTGAKASYGYYLTGYGAFNKGESKVFSGVRLIDDKTFSVTMAAEYLPYFYELPNVSVGPTKLSFWTDETVTIKDDGEGAYFSDNFTAEAYQDRWNVARYEAATFPASGAYKLVSFDTSAEIAVMEVNENYPGDYTGKKPLVKTVIYKRVTAETALDELSTGQVDILSQMASGDEINAGLDLVDKGGFSYTSYPRAGYGKLVFQCDFGPTQFVEVRQAVAHLLDRNDFAKAFTGGFGTVVNGPYGESMWFYQENKATFNEKLNPYPYSLDSAVKVLEEGGWVLDASGNPYKEGIRHKKLADGTIMPLSIEWASSENNAVSDLLVVKLQENPDLAAAGIAINQTVMTFTELLNYMYRDASVDAKYGVPTYGMYNLATNYTPIYDPTTTFTTDPEMVKAGYNTNFLLNKDLESKAKAIPLTDPSDRAGFLTKFADYVVLWNELLPDLPLYSNLYHDFYNEKLKDYAKNPLIRIDKAILYSYVTE